MLFKLSYTAGRLDIHSRDLLKFELGGPENIRLLVRAPTDEEQSEGHKSFNAFLDIMGEFKPTERSLPVFNALFEGRRPPEGETARSAEEMIHREGPSYDLEYHPDPFVSFVDTVYEKLSSVGRTLVSILRWRHAQEGPPSPIGGRGLFCSYDNGDSWHPLPGRYSILRVTPPHSVLESHKIDTGEILGLMEMNSREPVGHELLREAKELQHSSPRSAVLIAVSAVEVAVKSVIVDKVPDAAWLVETMQSPPVVDILTHYFPRLFPGEKRFYEPTKERGLIKTIYDAVHIRNQIAHKGVPPPKIKKIAEIIAAVQELLWVCDYHSGHTWAELHIQSMRQGSI
ncbi:MAG: hypothetical protein ACHBNF_21630 [Chromatiales bacterium]